MEATKSSEDDPAEAQALVIANSTDNGASTTSVEADRNFMPTTTDTSNTLAGMPPEILKRILDFSSPIMMTVFSLVCTRFFAVSQPYVQKNPVKLGLSECGVRRGDEHDAGCGCHLYELLTDWIGPRYTLYKIGSFGLVSSERFLLTATFPPESNPLWISEKIRALEHRYRDYDYTRDLKHVNSLLPNPFEMGSAWYGEAEKVILASLYDLDDLETWRDLWYPTYIFRNSKDKFEKAAKDEYTWREWSEGIALMGF